MVKIIRALPFGLPTPLLRVSLFSTSVQVVCPTSISPSESMGPLVSTNTTILTVAEVSCSIVSKSRYGGLACRITVLTWSDRSTSKERLGRTSNPKSCLMLQEYPLNSEYHRFQSMQSLGFGWNFSTDYSRCIDGLRISFGELYMRCEPHA